MSIQDWRYDGFAIGGGKQRQEGSASECRALTGSTRGKQRSNGWFSNLVREYANKTAVRQKS